MAPKATERAYASRDAALPDVRPGDFDDIAGWLAAGRQIMHSGGLRHAAFARLEVNDILRFEQECSIWRARCLPVLGAECRITRAERLHASKKTSAQAHAQERMPLSFCYLSSCVAVSHPPSAKSWGLLKRQDLQWLIWAGFKASQTFKMDGWNNEGLLPRIRRQALDT